MALILIWFKSELGYKFVRQFVFAFAFCHDVQPSLRRVCARHSRIARVSPASSRDASHARVQVSHPRKFTRQTRAHPGITKNISLVYIFGMHSDSKNISLVYIFRVHSDSKNISCNSIQKYSMYLILETPGAPRLWRSRPGSPVFAGRSFQKRRRSSRVAAGRHLPECSQEARVDAPGSQVRPLRSHGLQGLHLSRPAHP